MRNRRAVGLLNPMRDKNSSREPGGRRDDTRDHGLSRSWKVEVSTKKKKKKEAPQANILAAKNRCFFIAEARGRLRRSSQGIIRALDTALSLIPGTYTTTA